MKARIYHNPRCSKSRQTLALLQEKGCEVEEIRYLDTPPSAETLLTICKQMDVAPLAIARTKEALFKELGLSAKDDRPAAEWADLLAANPKLIERPIVEVNGRYAMGRPPENVLELL